MLSWRMILRLRNSRKSAIELIVIVVMATDEVKIMMWVVSSIIRLEFIYR